MAQYSESLLIGIDQSSDEFRYVNVSGDLYLRQTITPTGFDGVENTDWKNIEVYPNSGGSRWRVGARDLYFVLDCTITGIGFDGTEDIDWENHEKHKLA